MGRKREISGRLPDAVETVNIRIAAGGFGKGWEQRSCARAATEAGPARPEPVHPIPVRSDRFLNPDQIRRRVNPGFLQTRAFIFFRK